MVLKEKKNIKVNWSRKFYPTKQNECRVSTNLQMQLEKNIKVSFIQHFWDGFCSDMRLLQSHPMKDFDFLR